MDREIGKLTKQIQKAIKLIVLVNNLCPLSKRWWMKELSKMKKVVNCIRAESYKNRVVEDHPSHQDLKQARQKYAEDIAKAKSDH